MAAGCSRPSGPACRNRPRDPKRSSAQCCHIALRHPKRRAEKANDNKYGLALRDLDCGRSRARTASRRRWKWASAEQLVPARPAPTFGAPSSRASAVKAVARSSSHRPRRTSASSVMGRPYMDPGKPSSPGRSALRRARRARRSPAERRASRHDDRGRLPRAAAHDRPAARAGRPRDRQEDHVTSKAVMNTLGVHQPTPATCTRQHGLQRGRVGRHGHAHPSPKAEGEIAFLLRKDPAGGPGHPPMCSCSPPPKA